MGQEDCEKWTAAAHLQPAISKSDRLLVIYNDDGSAMRFKPSPFIGVSFAMIVGVMGAALISPLYAIYKEAWQLQASDISLIYVVYMTGALCSLLFLGRLPDRAGFLPVMKVGMILNLIGTLISSLAWEMTGLIVGRFCVGVASSLLTTSAIMGLAKLSRPGQLQRAAMLTGCLLAFGFGLGPLLGGIMGQWAPYPLVTTYIPTLVLGAWGYVVLSRQKMPATAQSARQSPLRAQDLLPKLTWPGRVDSETFVLTCALSFLAYGVFGLFTAMAPLFLEKLLPWHGPMVSGTSIAVILFASAVLQVMAGRIPVHLCGFAGLLGLALSMAFLMINLWAGSAVLFALSVLLTATGHGLSMLAGMNMVNRLATEHNRSGLLSTYFVIGYVGCMLPMMAMGWIADRWGMRVAVCCFCATVIVLGALAGVLFLRHPRMRAAGRWR